MRFCDFSRDTNNKAAAEEESISVVKASCNDSTHLVLPSCTFTCPYSSPNDTFSGRSWSKPRPSSRTSSRSALRMKSRSVTESNASLFMIAEADLAPAGVTADFLGNFLHAASSSRRRANVVPRGANERDCSRAVKWLTHLVA